MIGRPIRSRPLDSAALLALILAHIGIFCGIFCASCASEEPEEDLPPDVAVILIDTLRKDFLDLYGHAPATAPYLRALGERSAVFDRAYATSSWTAPSTATVMTGLYPQRHGVVLGYNAYGKKGKIPATPAGLEGSALTKLPRDISTMGEVFAKNGYQTFGVASNVNLSGERGFERGFQRFETSVTSDAEALRSRIADWTAERRTDRPAFWYLHLNDVHKPYDVREPWFEKREHRGRTRLNEEAKDRYRSEIGYVDSVLATLREGLGWSDDTVIIVIADHGEEFREHRGSGHHFKLYGELINIPMMICAPGLTDGGMRIGTAVSLIDVLPTLKDLLGLEDSAPRDGLSLAPLLRQETLPARPLFAHRRHPKSGHSIWAVIDDRWKLLYFEDRDRVELFHALDDPLDQKSLTYSRPEVAERLRGLIQAARQMEPLAAEEHVMDGGQPMLDHLREMGYGGEDDDNDEDDE